MLCQRCISMPCCGVANFNTGIKKLDYSFRGQTQLRLAPLLYHLSIACVRNITVGAVAFSYLCIKKQMFSFFKKLFFPEPLDFTPLLNRNALIIDVRSAQEFASGHANGSINIPLGQLADHFHEIQQQDRPVITCCRSGMRSARAITGLQTAGIEAYNGGTWQAVQAAMEES